MKTGTYVGYSERPREVAILRSTATRHLIVTKTIYYSAHVIWQNAITRAEDQLENPTNPQQGRNAAIWLGSLLNYKSGEEYLSKTWGTWVTHARVFNIVDDSVLQEQLLPF